MGEIISETYAKTGDSGRILHVMMEISMSKPPIRDQPKDIEKQLRKMALKYITPPNVIILAVTPANTNLTNSDGLTLAREVDPKGARTIGVLTKIDLMDAGTDVVEVLAGRVIPLPLGYVPVVNRSQRDIDMGKSISQSLKEELSFFENHSAYKIKSQYCGISFLSWKLALIMRHQIFNTLPDVEEKIQAKLKNYQNELPDLDSMSREGPAGVGLAIITRLCNEFRTVIDGNIAKSKVPGVNYTFVIQELLTEGVESLNPANQVTEEDAQMIEKLKGPSLACVESVYDELVRIVEDIVSKEMFKRLPQLKDPIYQAIISYLERQRNATDIFVSDLISTEGCNVITGHYDHFSGQTAMPLARERENPSTIIQPVNSQGSSSSTATASPRLSSELKPIKRGLVRFLSKKKKNKGTGDLDVPPAIPDANRNLLDYEQTDLKELAKPIITGAVPNAIMLSLVNTSKDELLRELLPVLGKMKNLNEVFEASRKRQKECIEMTEALKSAQALLAELKSVFSQRS
ncbi:vacuolar protein sorting-associated protein 1 [Linnemannia elongata]|nr:vacuolar protein sorting-associated protein 1 [Linnemannia elongata]